MIATGQAGPPNGNAHLLPEARLGIDAGREAQRVAQGDGELVLEIFRRDDVHAAGRADDLRRGFRDDGAGGDDDPALLGLFGQGRSGQGTGERAQRNAARNGKD